MSKISSKCTKNRQKYVKYTEISKISANIYKKKQNPWKYANNWVTCKLKSQTPSPGHMPSPGHTPSPDHKRHHRVTHGDPGHGVRVHMSNICYYNTCTLNTLCYT